MEKLLKEFPAQCASAIELGEKFNYTLPSNIQNIWIMGMGGSGIGGELMVSLVKEFSPFRIEAQQFPLIPYYVFSNTLAILVSYSGNTKEVLDCYYNLQDKKVPILAVTSGGELAKIAKRDKVPVIIVPSGYPPRGALGYLFFPLLTLFSNLLIVKHPFNLKAIPNVLEGIKEMYLKDFSPLLATAEKVSYTLPLILASTPYLKDVARRWKCQINENAKALALCDFLPEFNHNTLCFLNSQKDIDKKVSLLLLRDPEEEGDMKIAVKFLQRITQEIYLKEFFPLGENKLERAFSLIYLGDIFSIYLARYREQDPAKIPLIEQWKDFLSRSKDVPQF